MEINSISTSYMHSFINNSILPYLQLKRARESEAVEMAAALEAAGVATSSALRRAELEEETDGMIEALICRYEVNE